MTLQLMDPNLADEIVYYDIPKRKKLAGVKFGIYNPHMASWVRSETDDNLAKLPSEHSRSTVPGYVDVISQEGVFSLYDSPVMTCPSFFTLSEEDRAYRDDTPSAIFHPQDMTQAKVWKKRRIPLKQYRVVNIPVVKDYSFCSYGVRSTKPEVKEKWRDYVDINPNAPKSFLKRIPPRK